MLKNKSIYKPQDYTSVTLNELILIYRNYFNEENEYMQSKFTRKTMEKILKQEKGFMDKLMFLIDSRPTFKAYLGSIVGYDDENEVEVPRETIKV